MDHLDEKEWLARLRDRKNPFHPTYRAMFSTLWNGIVTDPALMMIPMDDHHVHRGDAIFEALKFIDGRVWLGREHLDRMEASAAAISMAFPMSRAEIERTIQETIRTAKIETGVVRLFLSRGPGSFGPNPYDSVGPQFHVVVTQWKPWAPERYQKGVSVGLSRIPVKDPWLARIKSCNYLPNVLMKKEAVDRGLDFTVGADDRGFLTEGSTENLFFLSKDGVLVRPRPEGILAGTTMGRAFELAEKTPNVAKAFEARDFTARDLQDAREIMMAGTTLDVIAVTTFEGRAVGDGKAGPVALKLRDLLIADQKS